MAEPHDWPLEQSARGTLRPFLSDVVGYLLVLFSDPEEAQRAQRALQDQGVHEGDIRLYDSEEIQRIAARLQQEQSFLAKAINEVVVDHQLRERWAAAAREGGSHLWVYAPTRERATRLVGLLADCHYELLHYLGEGGVETVEGTVGSTLIDQGNGRQDPDDHSDQHSGFKFCSSWADEGGPPTSSGSVRRTSTQRSGAIARTARRANPEEWATRCCSAASTVTSF